MVTLKHGKSLRGKTSIEADNHAAVQGGVSIGQIFSCKKQAIISKLYFCSFDNDRTCSAIRLNQFREILKFAFPFRRRAGEIQAIHKYRTIIIVLQFAVYFE